MVGFFSITEAGKRAATGITAGGESVGAFAVRYADIPVQFMAASLTEGGRNLAQLGMHGPAVIALVVIL